MPEVSLYKSILDLDEEFDSKEDILLYFVAIKQKINCFQKTIFHKKRLAMIILAFRIEKLGKLILKLQAFEIAIIKKGDFKSLDLKIISGNNF